MKNPRIDKEKGIECLKRAGCDYMLEKWRIYTDSLTNNNPILQQEDSSNIQDSTYGRWRQKSDMVGAPRGRICN